MPLPGLASLEPDLNWVALLPLAALRRVWCVPPTNPTSEPTWVARKHKKNHAGEVWSRECIGPVGRETELELVPQQRGDMAICKMLLGPCSAQAAIL